MSWVIRFRLGESYFEHRIQRDDGKTSKGAFGRAVRLLDEAEYEAIVRAGFPASLTPLPDAASPLGLSETPEPFERPIVTRLVSRPFRDAAFAKAVQDAYAQTCAFTGLRIVNGGGRAEAQAAHIRPVANHGPDSVRNGIALCGTVHWMFDRGLISIAPDWSILRSSSAVPDQIGRLLNTDGRVRLPANPLYRPAPVFLDYHRQAVFKG